MKWPEVADEIWFKADLNPYDPEKYQGLLKRVVEHVNAGRHAVRQGRLHGQRP